MFWSGTIWNYSHNEGFFFGRGSGTTHLTDRSHILIFFNPPTDDLKLRQNWSLMPKDKDSISTCCFFVMQPNEDFKNAKNPFTKILVQSVRLSHCIQVLPIFPFNPFFVFLNIITFFFFPVKLQKNNTFKITKKCTFFSACECPLKLNLTFLCYQNVTNN